MDQVVQTNAANAEESAGASEELNAQAEQRKGIVGDLVADMGIVTARLAAAEEEIKNLRKENQTQKILLAKFKKQKVSAER
jgi:hypothetical protein